MSNNKRRGTKSEEELKEVVDTPVENSEVDKVDNTEVEGSESVDTNEVSVEETLKKKVAELEEVIKEKDSVIKEQSSIIEEFGKEVTTGNSNIGDVAVGITPKENKVKVKMLKDHSFSVGGKQIVGIKGNTIEVDLFIANKLSGRGIAILVN